MEKRQGTNTTTPRTSPAVRRDQSFEATPAVVTRASEAQQGKHDSGMDTCCILLNNLGHRQIP
eukprot:8440500-Pyramimonas_sp.AAC.1